MFSGSSTRTKIHISLPFDRSTESQTLHVVNTELNCIEGDQGELQAYVRLPHTHDIAKINVRQEMFNRIRNHMHVILTFSRRLNGKSVIKNREKVVTKERNEQEYGNKGQTFPFPFQLFPQLNCFDHLIFFHNDHYRPVL